MGYVTVTRLDEKGCPHYALFDSRIDELDGPRLAKVREVEIALLSCQSSLKRSELLAHREYLLQAYTGWPKLEQKNEVDMRDEESKGLERFSDR